MRALIHGEIIITNNWWTKHNPRKKLQPLQPLEPTQAKQLISNEQKYYAVLLYSLGTWWPALSQDHEYLRDRTHEHIARIPERDRPLALKTYRFTLYHAPTKSWALVFFPSVHAVDIRVFNPNSEALKYACNELVHGLRKARLADGNHTVPISGDIDDVLVEKFVMLRRTVDKMREQLIHHEETEITESSMPNQEVLGNKNSDINSSDMPTNKPNPAKPENGDAIPGGITIETAFPVNITVLQPEVPELAFEGIAIPGTRLVYTFRSRRPDSLVAALALLIGSYLLLVTRNDIFGWILPGSIQPSSSWGNATMGRIATAFLATSFFALAGVLVKWWEVRQNKAIDWQV